MSTSSNPWRDALEKFNVGRRWTIPKRGTLEYDQVKATMNELRGGAYNVNSIRCTDKAIRIGQRGTPGECFKKGLKVGYRAGVTRQAPPRQPRHAQPARPQRPDLESMSLRELGGLAQRSGVRGYSRMTKRELYDRLVQIHGQPQ